MLPLFLLILTGWLTTTHISPWVSWHAELPFFAAMLGAAILALWRNRRSNAISLPKELILPVGLLAILVAQWSAGLIAWHGQAIVVALYLALIGIALGWGWREASQVRAEGHLAIGEWLAWALLVGCLLSLFVAMAQVLDIWQGQSAILRMPTVRRPGANLGQPNHLATLFVMGLMGVVYLQVLGRIGLGLFLLLALLFSAGVAVTESRTGLIALVALSIWCLWRRPAAEAPIARAWFLILPVFAGGLFVVWPHLFQKWSMGAAAAASGVERLTSSGSDSRVALWSQALEASWLRPWFGWGMRDTAAAHNAVAHAADYSLPFTYSHNIVLDMAIWIGWPLTLLVTVAILIWLVARCVRPQSPTGWFGMGLLIPFGIHSLLEFPYAYAYLLMPAMIGVGYAAAAGRPSRTVAIPMPLAWAGMAVIAVAGLWSVVDYLRVEEDYRDARFEMLRIGPPRTTPPPKILLLDQMGDLLASTRIAIKPDMSAAELELLRGAALHNPWSGTQYRFAHALALNGQTGEAMRQLRVLKAQHGKKAHDALRGQIEESLAKHHLSPLPPTPVENG